MKIDTNELMVFGGVAALVYFIVLDEVNKIGYRLSRAGIDTWNKGGYMGISADIAIDNKSKIPIGAENFTGKAYWQGEEIADVGLIQPVNISSESTGILRLGINVPYTGAARAILSAIGQGVSNEIKIKGTIFFKSGVRLPINTSFGLW